MPKEYETFRKNLNIATAKAGIKNIKHLAKISHTSINTLYSFHKRKSIPKHFILKKIAAALNTTTDELLKGITRISEI